MKLWRFFRVPENLWQYRNLRPQDKFPLYAITNKKKYAEAFQKGRSKKFYICQSSSVGKHEGMEYMNKNRSNVLSYHELETSDENHESRVVKVLMTEGEHDIIEEMSDSASIFKDVFWSSPDIFKKDIFHFLTDISYSNYYKLITGNLISYEGNYSEVPEYTPWFDELGVFIYYYHIDLNLEVFPKTIKY